MLCTLTGIIGLFHHPALGERKLCLANTRLTGAGIQPRPSQLSAALSLHSQSPQSVSTVCLPCCTTVAVPPCSTSRTDRGEHTFTVPLSLSLSPQSWNQIQLLSFIIHFLYDSFNLFMFYLYLSLSRLTLIQSTILDLMKLFGSPFCLFSMFKYLNRFEINTSIFEYYMYFYF